MDEVPLAKHLVYVKDADGNTRRIGETVVNNIIIQHIPVISCLDQVLEEIKEFPTRHDDIWLLDFAKSGTHWILGILELLLSRQVKPCIENNSQGIIELCQSLKTFETLPSPRVINTHMKLGMLPRGIFQNNKVIIMMRNPKSIAVSLYHHLTNLPYCEYNGTFSGFLPDFIKGHSPELYGNWFDYVVELWKTFRDIPNALFVFYEELKKDPEKIIKSISQFLGLDHDANYIADVAKQTSLHSMKSRQKQVAGEDMGQYIQPFYRKGVITDWKNHFTVAQNEMFDDVFEEKMKDYPDLKKRIQFY